MLLLLCSKTIVFQIYQRIRDCKMYFISEYQVPIYESKFYFALEFFLGKNCRKKSNVRVSLIWLDYKFSQCISLFFFSFCNIGCHNDLNIFPWKKIRCRESKVTQKRRVMNKSQTIYNFLGDTDILFWQYVLYWNILVLQF